MKELLHLNPDVVARRCAVKSPDYRQLTSLDWIVLDFADGLKTFSAIAQQIPAKSEDVATAYYHLRLLGFITWQSNSHSNAGEHSDAGVNAEAPGAGNDAVSGSHNAVSSGVSQTVSRSGLSPSISRSSVNVTVSGSGNYQRISSSGLSPRIDRGNPTSISQSRSSFGSSPYGSGVNRALVSNAAVPRQPSQSGLGASGILKESSLRARTSAVSLAPAVSGYSDEICAQYLPPRLFTTFRRFQPTLVNESLEIPVEAQAFIEFIHENLATMTVYDVLGLPEGTTDKALIRQAYMQRTKLFHPDRYFRKNTGAFAPRIAAIFKAVSSAFSTLQSQ